MIKKLTFLALAFGIINTGVVFSQEDSEVDSEAEMGDEDWLNTVWTQVCLL